MAIYDQIGGKYDQTRRADPYLVQRLMTLLKATPARSYLDVACGTGNYSAAMADSGFRCYGIDHSLTMLTTAQHKSPAVTWYQGDVHNMPLLENAFNGAFCMLGIHHFENLENAFQEVVRVISDGRFVIFTSTPEQMRGYWLNEYFPVALEKSAIQMPSLNRVRLALQNAGFRLIETEAYAVRDDLQDRFFYSGKHRLERYLDPLFRQGISTFRLLTDVVELETGCNRLQNDIQTGRIADVMKAYEHSDGDYLWVVSEVILSSTVQV